MSRLTKIYSQPEVVCILSYASLENLLPPETFEIANEIFLETPCNTCTTCIFYLTGNQLKETLCPD